MPDVVAQPRNGGGWGTLAVERLVVEPHNAFRGRMEANLSGPHLQAAVLREARRFFQTRFSAALKKKRL